MKRCRHELADLIPIPDDITGKFARLLSPEQDLLICRKCGRVGYYTKWGRNLAWLRPADAERAKQRAEEFQEWNEKRQSQETQPKED